MKDSIGFGLGRGCERVFHGEQEEKLTQAMEGSDGQGQGETVRVGGLMNIAAHGFNGVFMCFSIEQHGETLR